MPIIKSAKKANRQTIRRRTRNLARKNVLGAAVKEYRRLVMAGNMEAANAKLPSLYKTIDKMSKVRFIKKNKANRMKSRLTKKLQAKKQ